MTDTPLERFKGILATIATTRPGLPIEDALHVARAVEERMIHADWAQALDDIGAMPVPDDHTPVEIAAAWCRPQPTIIDALARPNSGLIHAIKETRALSHMGLKAAKDACEYMRDNLLP